MQSTRMRICLVAPLILSLALPVTVSAQQRHAVDPSLLATAVAQHAAKQEADRAAIRQALARPEMQQMANRLGVDLARMNARVATLAGADLERSAAAARQVNDALAGGASNVVISTTTLIIALLVVILIIVAVK